MFGLMQPPYGSDPVTTDPIAPPPVDGQEIGSPAPSYLQPPSLDPGLMGPPEDPNSLRPIQLTPPPKHSIWQDVAGLLPTALGAGLALTAKHDRQGFTTPGGMSQVAIGAGLAHGGTQAMNSIHDRQSAFEDQQTQALSKSLSDRIEQLRMAGGYGDPRIHQIIDAYDKARVEGQGILHPQQMAQIDALLNSVPNLGEKASQFKQNQDLNLWKQKEQFQTDEGVRRTGLALGAKRDADISNRAQGFLQPPPGGGPIMSPEMAQDKASQQYYGDQTMARAASQAAMADPETGLTANQNRIHEDNLAKAHKPSAAEKPVKVTYMKDGKKVIEYLKPGNVLGKTFDAPLSGTVENRVSLARASLEVGNSLMERVKSPEFAAVLGPILGRYKTIEAAAGAGDSAMKKLQGELESFSDMQMGIHGSRAHKIVEDIRKLLTTEQTPEALAAGLDGILAASRVLSMTGIGPTGEPSNGVGGPLKPPPGQPVKVNSPEEARALAPGTVFITPDGRQKVR